MPQQTDLNVSPYFDDYDPNKNYYKVLFKPSVALQARELNEVQSILQNQIESFGDSIYYHGSIVKGGQQFFDQSVYSVKLQNTYSNAIINVNNSITGLYAVGRTSNTVAKIRAASQITSSDPAVLVYKIVTKGANNARSFVNNEIIDVYSDFTNPTTLKITYQAYSTNSFSLSSIYSVDEAIYYCNGTFVKSPAQQIIVNKFGFAPNCTIGYSVSENFVNYLQDTSLTDNALGYSNENAPGADRFSINLILTTNTYGVNTTSNFIPIAYIQNNQVQKDLRTPIYSVLGDTMARRTYEEAGDFTVNPFYLRVSNTFPTANAVLAKISPGTAFVQGYEYTFQGPTFINVNKARTTESVSSVPVITYSGNYTYVNSVSKSIPNINSGLLVELHNVIPGSTSSSTKIGTANLRDLIYVSGTSNSAIFNLSLFNIQLTSNQYFGNTRSFVLPGGGGSPYSNLTLSMTVDSSAINSTSNSTQLYDTNYNNLVFPIGEKNIASSNNVSYTFKRVYKDVSFATGNGTITAFTTNEQFSPGVGTVSGINATQNFEVVVKQGSGTFANGVYVPLDTNSRSVYIPAVSITSLATATINVNDATFNGTADIISTISVSADTRRAKTLVSNYTAAGANIQTTNTISMGVCDINNFYGIYYIGNVGVTGVYSNATSYSNGQVVVSNNVLYISQLNSNVNNALSNSSSWVVANNIMYQFSFDDGQRDSYYDFGSVSYNGTTTLIGNTVAVVDYFTHSGGYGYLSADSYPISYDQIPSYTTSTGNVLQLRDCYDFRPRRTDGSGTYVFNTFQLPIQSVTSSHSYYLSRIDKIILSKDGNFIIKSGIPAYITPQYPPDISDGLTLFVLQIPAYTFNASDIVINTIPHRRYTMKDIGSIDQRLTSVEYYTALNLLEQQVNSQTVVSNTGTTLFKNGFLVDPFVGSNIADVLNPDNLCSIDYVDNYVRAPFTINALNYNSSSLVTNSSIVVQNNYAMLPYTEKNFISQKLASDNISVNPFDIIGYFGSLYLNPSQDYWVDTTQLPDVTVNSSNVNANWVYSSNAWSSEWNSWKTIWTGIDVSIPLTNNTTITTTDTTLSSLQNTYNSLFASGANSAALSTAYAAIVNYNQQQAAVSTTVASNGTVVGSQASPRSSTDVISGNKVVNISVVPYARSSNVTFQAFGLAPLSKLYVFVNNILCSAYVQPWNWSTNSYDAKGTSLYSDKNGNAKGILTLPSNQYLHFPVGQLSVSITNSWYQPQNATTGATATFSSQGLLQTNQKTSIVTPTPVIPSNNVITSTTGSGSGGGPGPSVGNTTPTGNITIPNGLIPGTNGGHGIDETIFISQNLINSAVAGDIGASRLGGLTATDSTFTNISNSIQNAYTSSLGRAADIGGLTYWVGQVTSGALSLSDVVNQFVSGPEAEVQSVQTAAASGNPIVYDNVNVGGSVTTCINGASDPVAESFFVDSRIYPNGIFLSSADIFFVTKDTNEPVFVQIRPNVNGYPSSNSIVEDSTVYLNSSQVNIFNPYASGPLTLVDSTNNSNTNITIPDQIQSVYSALVPSTQYTSGTPVATNFKFRRPIYLAPGEYSIVVGSNSNKYNVFIATVGQYDIASGNQITSQPYIGSLFKSQNASTWTADQTSDLAFILYSASFDTSANCQFTIPLAQSNTSLPYDVLHVNTNDFNINGVTSSYYYVQTKLQSSNTLGSSVIIQPNNNYYFNSRQIINSGSSTESYLNGILTSIDSNISPMIDLSRLSSFFIKNIINNTTDIVNSETLFAKGDALAKYVTKPVTLSNNIAATSLRVFLQINRRPGTTIEVYYKILNNYDNTAFSQRPYVKMTEYAPTPNYVQNTSDFIEFTYKNDNISYISNGSTYPNFNVFAIKIVMYSSNPSVVPLIKNLRVIAAS